VLVVATNGTGTGPLPLPEDADWITFDITLPTDMVAAIQAGNAAVANPPAQIVARIEAFDPDRTAIVVGDFLNESPEICGRPFLAHRRPEWLALDDKTVIDAFWDQCGITRAPSAIVDAAPAAVRTAFATIDRGAGVIVNSDATEGWTGGGHGVRWARSIDEIDEALAGWSAPGRCVRLMPFLEGIPCSVHGIVFDDQVIALRPVEMVTLRKPDGAFFYAGCASFWDPPDADREQMRAMARVAGARLRDEVAYRGPFTIDGVMTADGFLPTELNPRNGAGLNVMSRTTDVPLQLVFDALVGGVSGDWRPTELEQRLLDCFDANRTGGTWRALPVQRDALEEAHLDIDGVDVTYTLGPSAVGTFIRAVFDAAAFPTGRPAGPYAQRVWTELDRRHELGLPLLTAALEAR
jgi:hypothetical protein